MPLPSRPALAAAALTSASLAGGCVPRVEPPQGQAVEQVASLSEKPGDPAVTADGRLVFTMHPLNRPTFKLMERKADGTVVPFPDPDASRTAFDNPLGIRAGRAALRRVPRWRVGWFRRGRRDACGPPAPRYLLLVPGEMAALSPLGAGQA